MVEIRLPAYVFEPNLAGNVAKLLDGSQSGSIIMDFEAVRFYIPAAIVATLAQIGTGSRMVRRSPFVITRHWLRRNR